MYTDFSIDNILQSQKEKVFQHINEKTMTSQYSSSHDSLKENIAFRDLTNKCDITYLLRKSCLRRDIKEHYQHINPFQHLFAIKSFSNTSFIPSFIGM